MCLTVSDNNVCPAPVDDSDVTITPCDAGGNDGVCGLQCINSASHYVSAATPEYRPCGVLGVYYWDAPHMDLVLPTCSGIFFYFIFYCFNHI